MKPSPEQIRAFLAAFGDADFPHAADVLPLLKEDGRAAINLMEYSAARHDLADLYRRRANRLASVEVPAPYPPTLARDVGALAAGLEGAQDSPPIRVWHLELPDGAVFILTELVTERKLAGVVRSVSRRIVSPDESFASIVGPRC